MICYVAYPDLLVLGSQVIITARFTRSLELVLGDAGSVAPGHVALFGLGA
jgi:ABC-type branched-subunit amino acid transport system permease subunit